MKNIKEKIIEVKDLKKSFKISKRMNGLPGHIANLFKPKYEMKEAVKGIDFEIYEGECVGFIGANGAGKSTTIKMLSGILYPDSGYIDVMGFEPLKDRKKYVANIGVVFGQKSQLSWDLPVIDSFELLKNIYKIPSEMYKKNLDEFVELLDMSSFINQPVRQLSLGQRMRADIAASLLHSPKLVFFDEPTIGLDVVAKEKIREFVRYMNKEKKVTFIFTTHDMQDIAKTCERIIIIDKGSKMYDGGVKELVDEYGGIVKLAVEIKDVLIDDEYIKMLKQSLQNQFVDCEFVIEDKKNNVIEIMFENKTLSTVQVTTFLTEKFPLKDFRISDIDIEEIVRKIYEGGITL